MAKVIKPAETFVWDVKKPAMHGSQPEWEGRKAQGNLRRMGEKPRGSKRP